MLEKASRVWKEPIKHEAKSDGDTDDGDIDDDDDTGDDNDDVGESPIDLAWPDGVPAAKQPSICNCHRHANYISLRVRVIILSSYVSLSLSQTYQLHQP